MASGHTHAELRRFQGGGEARMVFAVDIHAGERVVRFPEETPKSERPEFRAYTARSLRCIVPDCRAPLVANFREAKRDGFSHHEGTGNHSATSLWHEQGQHLIEHWTADRYPMLHVAIERASADRTRRPDITVTGETGAIAVEVQYASIAVDPWQNRHTDLARQYLAQTWLLGHHGEHFKLAKNGSLKFSALMRAMAAAGCIPLWLNPETAEVLTAWSRPDEHGPTPPHTLTAHGYEVVPLNDCSLTGNGLMTPALEAIVKAAAQRSETAHQRASAALRIRRQRQQAWEGSEVRAWLLDRHEDTVPSFIADGLRGDTLMAEKLDLTTQHWKTLAYRQIVAEVRSDWVTYKSIIAALARGQHRALGNTQFDTLNAYLRLLERAGEIALLKSGRLHIRGARSASPAADASTEAFDGPIQGSANATEHFTPIVEDPIPEPKEKPEHDDFSTALSDRSAAIQEAVLAETVDVTRRSRRWRLRRFWLRRR